jgi:hypothetical protein
MNKRKSMNGFLVVAHFETDTLPLRLCSTRKEALEFISEADEGTIVIAMKTIYHRTAQRSLGVVSMAVIDFRDGVPLDRDVVRYLEGEPVKVKLERVWREMGFRSDKGK